MKVTLEEFNALPEANAREELMRCCGSTAWVSAMVRQRPFKNIGEMSGTADRIWENLSEKDWKEAFSHHPRIGDVNGLRAKFASTRAWAEGEQSGVRTTTDEVLHALAVGNVEYEKRFGYIFIVCATGKSAGEMLDFLNARIHHTPDREILIAAGEQAKITHLRLQKLLGDPA